MYEFHGWFSLSDNTYDMISERVDEALPEIQAHLDRFEGRSLIIDLRWLNGIPTVTLQGELNRRLGYGDLLTELLDLLARRLPGSYGLVYERDDERVDPPGGNAFRVRVLARGAVTERDDPFLSPSRPVIED